jgi:hypothetical protein
MLLPLMIFQKENVMFSDVTNEDLKNLGVERKPLVLVDAKLSDLTKSLTMEAKAHIQDLKTRIDDIYACVNMEVRLVMIMVAFGCLNYFSIKLLRAT